jgi:hypothetical protein
VIAATQDDLLAGILAGGAVLLIVLLVWVLVHHANPGVKIDIGVRGWVSLKPGESAADQQVSDDERTGSDDDGDHRPGAGAIDAPDH